MSATEQRIYREFVDSLLYHETCRALRTATEKMQGLDRAAFRTALAEKERDCLESGLRRTAELVDFVRGELADLIAEEPTPAPVTDEASLIAAAKAAPNALRARSLLRAHEAMVTADLFDRVQEEAVMRQQPPPPEILRLQWLIALLLGDSVRKVKSRLLWGSLHRSAGRLTQAERHLRRAAAESEQIGGETRLMVLGAQAGFYRAIHDLPHAIDALEKYVAIAKDDSVVAIALLESLASCYRDSGQPGQAVDASSRCLGLLETNPLPEREIRLLEIRGLAYEDLGSYEAGRNDYLRAAAIAESIGDRNRQFIAMNNAAASLLKRGLARESYREFLAIQRTVTGWGNPVMAASTHNNLGQALLQMKRYAEARSHFGQSLAARINAGHSEGEIISLIGLGEASEGLKDVDAARTFYQLALVPALESNDGGTLAAIQMRLAAQDAGGGETAAAAESLRWARDLARAQGQLVYEVTATAKLAGIYDKLGNLDLALSELDALLARPIDHGVTGMLTVQVDRARLLARSPGGWQEGFRVLLELLSRSEARLKETVLDSRRAEIAGETVEVYQALLALLANAPPSAAVPGGLTCEEFAFDLHESAKGRSLLAGLADAPLAPPPGIPDDLREAERALLERERALQDESDRTGEASRQEQLAGLARDLTSCWERMKPFAPDYVRYRSGEPYNCSEASAWLDRQVNGRAAMLTLFSDRDAVTAFILRAGSRAPLMRRLTLRREDLEGVATRLSRAFNGDPEEFPPYPPIRGDAPYRRSLGFLDALSDAFQPVLDLLEGAEVICVAPHGPMHLIPFHALRTGSGCYLVERSAVVYAPSVSVFLQTASRSRGTTGGSPMRVLAAGVSSADDTHPEYFEDGEMLFDPAAWRVRIAAGERDASREAVLAGLTGQDVIHLSCHGYFDPGNPMRSGLVFSNGLRKAPRDPSRLGYLERRDFLLTAGDLMRAGLSVDLISLSACATGLQGVVNEGDELEGFSRALLLAGASTALLALWNLDQESSREFFRMFYRYYTSAAKAGEKWRALHAAQLEFLASPRPAWRHPYHWAPYTMIGSWR